MTAEFEELQEVLDSLNVEYGRWKANSAGIKYRAVADNDRYEVIKIFIEIMKGRGKEKEFFKISPVQNFVAEFFFPENRTEHYTAKKRKGVFDMVFGQMRQAVIEIFGKAEDIQSKPLESPVVLPPSPPRASKPAPKAEDKPAAYEKPKFVAEDVTETPYNSEGGTSDVSGDEEFAKLLGVKTNVWK